LARKRWLTCENVAKKEKGSKKHSTEIAMKAENYATQSLTLLLHQTAATATTTTTTTTTTTATAAANVKCGENKLKSLSGNKFKLQKSNETRNGFYDNNKSSSSNERRRKICH